MLLAGRRYGTWCLPGLPLAKGPKAGVKEPASSGERRCANKIELSDFISNANPFAVVVLLYMMPTLLHWIFIEGLSTLTCPESQEASSPAPPAQHSPVWPEPVVKPRRPWFEIADPFHISGSLYSACLDVRIAIWCSQITCAWSILQYITYVCIAAVPWKACHCASHPRRSHPRPRWAFFLGAFAFLAVLPLLRRRKRRAGSKVSCQHAETTDLIGWL